jgi:cytochrome c
MVKESVFRGISPERCLGLALAIVSLVIIVVSARSSAVAFAAQVDSGDVKRGQELFQKRCTSCHSLDSEKEGPRLRGVFGRRVASIPSFNYSDALKNARLVWDADSLDKWLSDTDKFIPDNDMNLSLKKPDERADIIAFLKQLSSQ